MKVFPAGLDTLLATREFVHADLYDFTLQDGTVLYYTTADTDITSGGNVYTSKGPYFEQISSGGSRWHSKAGTDADTWTVIIAPAATDPITGVNYPAKIYGQPWMVAVRVGALDGAAVDVHRAYWPSWPTRPWVGPLQPPYVLSLLFSGYVDDIKCGRSIATIKLESWMGILQRKMPRHVFSTSCRWTLFDPGCGLVQSSFGVVGTVVSVVNEQVFNLTGSAGAGYFALGQIKFTSGANAPLSRGIIADSGPPGAQIEVRIPFPYTINPGDAYIAYAGCDKTLATCTNKFGNRANFGGFPFVPPPETSV